MFVPSRLRVLLTGPVTRELHAIDSWFARQDSIVLVGNGHHNGDGARPPDLIVLRALRGAEAARRVGEILAQHEGARIVVVARSFEEDDAAQLLAEGARGVLSCEDLPLRGLRALRDVVKGEIWGPRSALSRLVSASIRQTLKERAVSKGLPGLTTREVSIVSLLQRGSSNKEIAANLGISDKTVKTHLQNIYGKLHVRRRQEIFSLARGAGPQPT